MRIGVVGKGFVGSAVQFGFSANAGCDAIVKVYDKDPNRSQHSLKEVLDNSDYILKPVGSYYDYNHLSVRSAVAIILDRIFGCDF